MAPVVVSFIPTILSTRARAFSYLKITGERERETEGGRKKEHLNSITSLTMKRIVLARRQFFCRGSNTRDGAFYRKNRFRSLIRGAIGRGQRDGIKRASFPRSQSTVRRSN